jgi:hypothetical protein
MHLRITQLQARKKRKCTEIDLEVSGEELEAVLVHPAHFHHLPPVCKAINVIVIKRYHEVVIMKDLLCYELIVTKHFL